MADYKGGAEVGKELLLHTAFSRHISKLPTNTSYVSHPITLSLSCTLSYTSLSLPIVNCELIEACKAYRREILFIAQPHQDLSSRETQADSNTTEELLQCDIPLTLLLVAYTS